MKNLTRICWLSAILMSAVVLLSDELWVSVVASLLSLIIGLSFSASRKRMVVLGALVAATTLLFRFIFRAIFSTPSQTQILIQLPYFKISSGISEFTLLGPISVETVTDGLSAGARLASIICCFAVASAIAPPKLMFAFAPINLQRLSLPVFVSLALLPELLESLAAQRTARRIRLPRRKSRWLAVFAPALESALLRSIELTSRFSQLGLEPLGTKKQQWLDDSVRKTAGPVSQIQLPDKGQLIALTGATGSGKTTQLRLVSEYWSSTGHRTILIGQNDSTCFVTLRVRDELEFSARLSGETKACQQMAIIEVCNQLNIHNLIDRGVEELSGGEQKLVVLAAAILLNPRVILLDEPFSQLDSKNSQRLKQALSAMKAAKQVGLVVAEHRDFLIDELTDKKYLIESTEPLAFPEVRKLQNSDSLREKLIMQVVGLSVRRGKHKVVDDFCYEFIGGHAYSLNQPNGHGKSTLLLGLAKVVRHQGHVLVNSFVSTPDMVRLVPQNLDGFFWHKNIDAEFAEAGGMTDLLQSFPKEILNANPLDLSAGSKRQLAVLLQNPSDTPVLLLDEPTVGLDKDSKQKLARLINDRKISGKITVVASHDQRFLDSIEAKEVEFGRR